MLNLRVLQTLKLSQQTTGSQAADIISLRKEVRLLRDQLAAATTSLTSLAPRTRIAALFEGGDEVASVGKKFAIVEQLWVDPDIFDSPQDLRIDPDTPERFATEDSYKQGTLAAICNMVPENLLQHMFIKEFRSTVRLCLIFVINL